MQPHRRSDNSFSHQPRQEKVEARLHYHPRVAHEGDAVRVFSRSLNAWMDGFISSLVEGNFVLVEFKVGDAHYCKMVHLHSERLIIPYTQNTSSSEEHDPAWVPQLLKDKKLCDVCKEGFTWTGQNSHRIKALRDGCKELYFHEHCWEKRDKEGTFSKGFNIWGIVTYKYQILSGAA